MPDDQHAPRPADDGPCDCGGCQEFRAIHGGFCAELPDVERRVKRINDRAAQIRFWDATHHSQAS